MKHIMFDLETFGTAPGSIIRSLGAVEFDLDGTTGASCYANIDRKSCEDVGLVADPRTEQWWSQQSKAAQESLLVDPQPLKLVATSFAEWVSKRGPDVRIWSQGAAFDPVLWEAACKAVRTMPVWKFWNTRDTRTVYDLFNFDVREITRDGTYHNALDDAIYQVKCVAAALKKGRAAAKAVDSAFA